MFEKPYLDQDRCLGKHLIKFLVPNVPYDIENKADRNEIKDEYYDGIIDMVTEDYIPNIKGAILKNTALPNRL